VLNSGVGAVMSSALVGQLSEAFVGNGYCGFLLRRVSKRPCGSNEVQAKADRELKHGLEAECV